MKFNKKIIEKKCVRQTTAGSIKTIEIPEGQKYEAGDWIVTGVKGEQHPIKNEKFEKLYEKVAGKQDIFRNLPGSVDAIQVRNAAVISTSWGDMKAKKGDWIADNGDSQYVIEGEVMEMTYERDVVLDLSATDPSTKSTSSTTTA